MHIDLAREMRTICLPLLQEVFDRIKILLDDFHMYETASSRNPGTHLQFFLKRIIGFKCTTFGHTNRQS